MNLGIDEIRMRSFLITCFNFCVRIRYINFKSLINVEQDEFHYVYDSMKLKIK